MNKDLAALAIASLFFAGCASQPVDTSKLNYEAKTYLMQAQYDTEAADRQNVNTVRAHDELSAAAAAANAGDNAATLMHAQAADAEALKAIKAGKK